MKRTKPTDPALSAAQAALLAHSDAWHRSSGADPKGCQECGDLILAVERERWAKVGDSAVDAILDVGRERGWEVGCSEAVL